VWGTNILTSQDCQKAIIYIILVGKCRFLVTLWTLAIVHLAGELLYGHLLKCPYRISSMDNPAMDNPATSTLPSRKITPREIIILDLHILTKKHLVTTGRLIFEGVPLFPVAWPRELEWEVQVAAPVVPAERLAQREAVPGEGELFALARASWA
jgi:hypothetical protein